jgi:hypothetical protein
MRCIFVEAPATLKLAEFRPTECIPLFSIKRVRPIYEGVLHCCRVAMFAVIAYVIGPDVVRYVKISSM